MVRSIERAIGILKTFSVDEPELGVAELSRRLGIPKSTVFRQLATLERGGLIRQNPDTGQYRLGVELIGLANNVLACADLRRISLPYLRQLAESLEETVNLSILDRDEIVNIEQIVSPDRLIMRVGWVGRRMPPHAVSSGKLLLAHLSEEALEEVLNPPLEAFTPHTVVEIDQLRLEFPRIKAQGYASSFEELEIGLHALSAPIRDHQGQVIACGSVSGPSYRLSPDRIAAIASQVIQTTDQIAYEMGYIHRDGRQAREFK